MKPVDAIIRPTTAKGWMEEINKFIAETATDNGRDCCHARFTGSTEGHKLWDILTALRGPDDGDYQLKDATTAVIRHAVCPDAARACGAIVWPDSVSTQSLRASAYGPVRGGQHFLNHAKKAFHVLGLEW